MAASNQLIYHKPRYSWNSILDATTWGILLYMLYMDIPSLKRLIGYVNLGITPLLIVVYALSILLAGIVVTLGRHRITYPVTFSSFLVNLATQLFVVMIASNPIHWQMFVFVILGQWLIVETLKAITLQKGVASSNVISFCILLVVIFLWRNLEQDRASLIFNLGVICFWITAEWLHTQQNTLVRWFQQTFLAQQK